MHWPIDRLLRRAAALALAALVAAPDLALASEPRSKPAAATKSLDAMSPAELDHFVQGLNESSNWRKFRRPGDPPDFVPGKPVRVMYGAGASFGRGGGGNFRSFRQSGLGSRRSGVGSRRRGNGSDQSAMERGRGSRSSGTSSSLGSNRSGSSFGSSRGGSSRSGSSSGRSSFGSGSSFGNGGGFNQ